MSGNGHLNQEESMMLLLRYSVLCLVLIAVLSSCVTAPEKERGKVICPACGTEFDAIYQKRF